MFEIISNSTIILFGILIPGFIFNIAIEIAAGNKNEIKKIRRKLVGPTNVDPGKIENKIFMWAVFGGIIFLIAFFTTSFLDLLNNELTIFHKWSATVFSLYFSLSMYIFVVLATGLASFKINTKIKFGVLCIIAAAVSLFCVSLASNPNLGIIPLHSPLSTYITKVCDSDTANISIILVNKMDESILVAQYRFSGDTSKAFPSDIITIEPKGNRTYSISHNLSAENRKLFLETSEGTLPIRIPECGGSVMYYNPTN